MPLDDFELATLEKMLKCVADGYAEREYVDNAIKNLRRHNKDCPIHVPKVPPLQKTESLRTNLYAELQILISNETETLENKLRKNLAKLLTEKLCNNLVICTEDGDRAEKMILGTLQQIRLEDLTND